MALISDPPIVVLKRLRQSSVFCRIAPCLFTCYIFQAVLFYIHVVCLLIDPARWGDEEPWEMLEAAEDLEHDRNDTDTVYTTLEVKNPREWLYSLLPLDDEEPEMGE